MEMQNCYLESLLSKEVIQDIRVAEKEYNCPGFFENEKSKIYQHFLSRVAQKFENRTKNSQEFIDFVKARLFEVKRDLENIPRDIVAFSRLNTKA